MYSLMLTPERSNNRESVAPPIDVILPTEINHSNQHRGTLCAEVISLTSLKDKSWDEMKHDSDSRDAIVFRAIATLAKRQWLHNQERYDHQDSIETLHRLFTLPSAETILLWAESPRRYAHAEPRILVGAALVITDALDIPDMTDMPWDFLRETVLPAFSQHGEPKICRGIRAFVSPTAYTIAPTERPLDIMTAAANELSRGGIVVTKIHVDNPRARNGFVALGYEPTGQYTPDTRYEWLVFPPFSNQALQEHTIAQKQISLLSLSHAREVTHAATYFDPLGADLAILGSKKQVLRESDLVSKVFPFSPVLSFVEARGGVSARRERPNLSFLSAANSEYLLPDKQVSGSLVAVDLTATDTPFATYIRQAAQTTRTGGKVIVKQPAAQMLGQAELETLLLTNGLRLISISSLRGDDDLENKIVVAEKVAPHQSIAIALRDVPASVPDSENAFVQFTYMRHRDSGRQWELGVFPADMALDALPYFEHAGQLYIGLVNRPRPIPHLLSDSLDGSTTGAFMAEQVSAFAFSAAERESMRTFVEAARTNPAEALQQPLGDLLAARTGITAMDAETIAFQHYYSSPGTVGEAVLACTVRVAPFRASHRDAHATNFAESGDFQPVLGQRALAAAQLGALSDGRVERMVYAAFRQAGQDPGPWLGTTFEFKRENQPPAVQDISRLRNVPERAAFEVLPAAASRQYLDHRRITVSELDQGGTVLSNVQLEYIEPHKRTGISNNTVSVVPLMRDHQTVYIGLELRDLPAPQLHGYSSQFYAIPAYRLPQHIDSMAAARDFLTEHLASDFGLLIDTPGRLGAHYFPTAGLTPETVYPFMAECVATSPENSDLHWFKLADVLQSLHCIRGGHTLTGLNRISHALGLLQ